MDRDLSQWVPQVGQDVIGADGEKVGEIDGVEREYFIVRKGFFFPQDHYIPLTAVSSYDDDKVYLNVTKDEALEQDWTNPPAAGYGVTGTTVVDEDLGAADTRRGADVDAANTTLGTQADETLTTTGAGYAEGDRLAGIETDVDRPVDTDVTDRDALRVPVHEEELAATTRPVERGQVRVTKDVVAEEQQLDVPVTEEHAHVTRRTVDRDVTPDDTAFQEGTIEVPLRGEEVDVDKRARVVEEVDIEKHAETGTRRVGDTVRREEVRVEGDDVVRDTDTDVDGNPIR
jgi:uncharacterized protein (TIGR02271 family)